MTSHSMNCDPIARYYQTAEHLSFGRSLERTRFAFLRETSNARRAIICGGGDGRFLARLLRLNPHVTVDFLDASSAMVHLARRRIAAMAPHSLPRVHFHVADIRAFTPSHSCYDVIVANFFFDCFSPPELRAVISRLSSWSIPQAHWIVSDFHEIPAPPLRLASRLLIRSMYFAFRIATGLLVTRLPDYRQALSAHGLRLCSQQSALAGLLHSSLWQSSS